MVTTLNTNPDDEWAMSSYNCNASGDPFTQSLYFIANYDFINNKVRNSKDSAEVEEYKKYKNIHDNTLRIGLYTHGRAGVYNEINYKDLNPDNQIKPTFWYNKQEPFEFEFVVNSPTGLQKIFDNLVLISNNAEPESLEISLLGDAYDFNKANIFIADNTTIEHDPETGILDTEKLKQTKLNAEFNNTDKSQNFDINFGKAHFNTKVIKDEVLNQYCLTVHDDCRNVST